jgi:hypothetical protein
MHTITIHFPDPKTQQDGKKTTREQKQQILPMDTIWKDPLNRLQAEKRPGLTASTDSLGPPQKIMLVVVGTHPFAVNVYNEIRLEGSNQEGLGGHTHGDAGGTHDDLHDGDGEHDGARAALDDPVIRAEGQAKSEEVLEDGHAGEALDRKIS